MITLKVIGLTVLALFVSGLLIGGSHIVLEHTNDMEFCTSCHSMQINFEEYKETIHYKNPSGVRATCADCHVPKPLGAKLWAKLVAAKDVYHELVGTIDNKEKFEARRWQMANRVWEKMQETDSRECRSCHNKEAMDLMEQDKMARKKHEDMASKGKTCIDCHKGIAHEEPDEPEENEES